MAVEDGTKGKEPGQLTRLYWCCVSPELDLGVLGLHQSGNFDH